MEKKIIACGLIMLLLVTCFVACGKKPTIKGKNGMEYVVVTDEEGSSVLNADGDIAVYVTDDRGRYVKDANGERQTNYIEFPNYIINENPSEKGAYTLETVDYRMVYPAGWKINNVGKATPTEYEKSYVDIANLGALKTYETLDSYFAKTNETVAELKEEMKDIYADVTYETGNQKVTTQQLDAKMSKLTAYDDKGEVAYFAQNIYFVYNGQIFSVTYICNEGYDGSVDLLSVINSGLTMKTAK